MTETPAKKRKAQERARMSALGLKRFEAYVHPLDLPRVRRYIERLTKRRQ